MRRRTFLAGVGSSTAMGLGGAWLSSDRSRLDEATRAGPTRAIIPVVGDGNWIWTKPPTDQTGYVEPRQYDVKIGIQLQGTGHAGQIKATTAAPVAWPEQRIDQVQVQRQGCGAQLRQIDTGAAQLYLAAPSIEAGQTIAAAAHYQLTLFKHYGGFQRDQFPIEQPSLNKQFRRRYLYDSPGIQTRFDEIKKLARQVTGGVYHPWDQAHAAYQWVWENIEGRAQVYTSVMEAIRHGIGDCEERAAVFVAMCRIAGIPARLVWLPNHNWAEFYLTDDEGTGHWIPAHTSAYSWFGWTGAHELVLQKGDSMRVPEKKQPQRLLADWMQWQGSRPKVRYLAELTPLPREGTSDAGPGGRRKNQQGEWRRQGDHPLDSYLRDGKNATAAPPDHLR